MKTYNLDLFFAGMPKDALPGPAISHVSVKQCTQATAMYTRVKDALLIGPQWVNEKELGQADSARFYGGSESRYPGDLDFAAPARCSFRTSLVRSNPVTGRPRRLLWCPAWANPARTRSDGIPR
jgi:hypothetical protein